ncbi:unnamed protein product, partial [Meganyctiphanes norvegica]
MCTAKIELESGDYIEMVDTTSQSNNVKYYLPFRGVRKDSSTTACRMVMDASSKASASDISLNQALYQGPNLILDLAFCLLRFMLGTFGVIADIEKAFLRILIAECDRDALRFFWYDDPYNRRSKLITYRYKAVMFGSVSSPFLLAAVLQKLIKDDCENIIVREALEKSIYVDNVVYATNSEDTILQFFGDSRTLLNKGNFNLRQWSSNSTTLMEQAKSSGVAEEGVIVRVLGLYWNLDTDRYLYNTNIEWDKKFTKRSALRFTNKVFDPLGLLVPISMRRRIFMQKLWTKNLKWDESFEFVGDFKDQWLHLVKEAHTSVTSTFTRNAQMTPKSEVHIFSDASKDSYGTVVYLRSPTQDLNGNELDPEKQCRGHVHLSCAKGKVAPIDGKQTIPKLELSGVLLAAHKVPYLKKAWTLPQDTKFIIWCDAKVVLCWLAKYNIKEIYVHNRVKQIRDLCAREDVKIYHVPTNMNPADIITKEQKAEDFVTNQTWWEGPKWLQSQENWPEQEVVYNLYPEGTETLSDALFCMTTSILATAAIDVGQTSLLKFFDRANFETSLRKLTFVLRAFPHKKRKTSTTEQNFEKGSVSKQAMDQAKQIAIKVMQADMFGEVLHQLRRGNQIKKGPYRKLNLFLDTQGIIRCMGRLQNLLEPTIKNDPIFVHGKHPFTESFIRYKHQHSNCASKQYTLHKVRQEVHGPSLTV